jgi:hypothetical protein
VAAQLGAGHQSEQFSDSPNDIVTLYRGFGFESREGGNHTIFFHPVHRHLIATVARHRSLPVGYVQKAIALIEALKTLQADQEN